MDDGNEEECSSSQEWTPPFGAVSQHATIQVMVEQTASRARLAFFQHPSS